jgi:tetratricopeptide (TPR) repeat protein
MRHERSYIGCNFCYESDMRSALALIAVLLLASPAGMMMAVPAAAQSQAQTGAVELDTLFGKLRDPAIGSDAMRVEQQIWDAWLHQGSDAENEALAKATLAMNIGDFKSADKMLTALVQTSPNFAEAWNKRATLYFLMQRYDESLADIVKVLDLEPRHFGALAGRGMIYQRLGRDADALAAYKDALTMNPIMPGAGLAVRELEKKLPEL